MSARRMNVFDMRGAWDPLHARLYDVFISRRIVPLYRRFAEEVAHRLPSRGRVLDVGCGAGRATTLLARRAPELDLLGIDLSETMVALARGGARGVDNVSFRPGDAMCLPLGDGSCDFVYSLASIKHWPDAGRGVREMARVARPGGTVFLLEADRGCSVEVAERFVGRWLMLAPLRPLLTRYFLRVVAGQGCDAAELQGHLEAAGIREIETRADEIDPVVWAVGTKPP